MPEQVIFSDSYGAVLADADVPCVIIQFYSFANQKQFKGIMDSGLAYYEAQYKPARPWGWVGDVRQMGAIPKAVQDWLVLDWNPRAYAAGIREISIVVAENVFGQIGTQQYAQNTVARAELYTIEPMYYPSLDAAKLGAARRLKA